MLHYQIEFDDYRQHLIHVTLAFPCQSQSGTLVADLDSRQLPHREFSKHIESVQASDEAGRYSVLKTGKNRWRLFNNDHELITVEYDVYAYDLSVRGRMLIKPVCMSILPVSV